MTMRRTLRKLLEGLTTESSNLKHAQWSCYEVTASEVSIAIIYMHMMDVRMPKTLSRSVVFVTTQPLALHEAALGTTLQTAGKEAQLKMECAEKLTLSLDTRFALRTAPAVCEQTHDSGLATLSGRGSRACKHF